MENQVRIVFMGTPDFAVPSLECLLASQYKVVAVYTQPDRPAGRRKQPTAPAVKKVAQAWGLPVIQTTDWRETMAIEQLACFAPDVIIVAAFSQLLPQAILSFPQFGCLNIHPSLLPQYRGASPVAAAILAGDEITGVTVMKMDAGLDTGPLLAQCQVTTSIQDTTGSLSAKLAQAGAELLEATLPLWLQGELKPQIQDESQASYTRMFTKEDGELDWRLPAVEVERRVRAFHPWPGCYTRWSGKTMKIVEAVPLPGEKAREPGRVVAVTGYPEIVGIETGDGVLGLRQIQLAGKREVPAAEFIRGQREFFGAILPSPGQ